MLKLFIPHNYCSVAPNFTPTNLTVLHKNATSVTISWTAVDATEADGYVVYYKARTEYQNDVGNTTQCKLTGLNVNSTNITVRAYQDLLGPPSAILSVETVKGEKSINVIC